MTKPKFKIGDMAIWHAPKKCKIIGVSPTSTGFLYQVDLDPNSTSLGRCTYYFNEQDLENVK